MTDTRPERIVCGTCGEELGMADLPWAARSRLFLHRSAVQTRMLLENMLDNAGRVGTERRPLPRYELVGHDRAVKESEFTGGGRRSESRG